MPACFQGNNEHEQIHEQIALKREACSIMLFFLSLEVNEVEGALFPISIRSIQSVWCGVWGLFLNRTFLQQQSAVCTGCLNW